MIKSGYSHHVILDNALTLQREGLPRKAALAAARIYARHEFIRRNPGIALPKHLKIGLKKRKP